MSFPQTVSPCWAAAGGSSQRESLCAEKAVAWKITTWFDSFGQLKLHNGLAGVYTLSPIIESALGEGL